MSNSPMHPFPQLERFSAIIPQLLRRKTDAKQKVKQLSPALFLLQTTKLFLIHLLEKLCSVFLNIIKVPIYY